MSHLRLVGEDNPTAQTLWLNVYPDGDVGYTVISWGYETREEADKHAMIGRVACIPVTFQPDN